MLGNGVGPEREEVTGDWRKLRNEELHDLYCSAIAVWLITSRRVRQTERVSCAGTTEICTEFW